MRRLNEFKVPNFKFKKIKMEGVENFDDLKKSVTKEKNKVYEKTNYKTIKEVFIRSREKYRNKVFILQKFNPKGDFVQITYKEFTDDVIAFGTALTNKYNLKDERIVIIGENTYHWYVSYMAMLCGVGIAVPVDKELPANELENVINRSRATAVIYTTKKKDIIKKVEEKLPNVKYFIQMNSDNDLDGKHIGMNTIINEGKKLVKNGDESFMNIEIDPEESELPRGQDQTHGPEDTQESLCPHSVGARTLKGGSHGLHHEVHGRVQARPSVG